jgi:hypothetical protein
VGLQVAFAGGRVLLALDGLADDHIVLLSEASAMFFSGILISAMVLLKMIHHLGICWWAVAFCEVLDSCVVDCFLLGESVLESAGDASLPYGGDQFVAVPCTGFECN